MRSEAASFSDLQDVAVELSVAVEVSDVPLVAQVRRDVPVLIGAGERADVLCPSCRRVVLIRNVVDDAVYDIAVRCAGCDAVSVAPHFPAGRGLGGVLRVVPRGQHVADSSFTADSDEVIIGEPGAERRAQESGRAFSAPRRVVMDVAGIERTLEEARQAFGPILADLEARYARRPAQQHRLPQLLGLVEENLALLRAGETEVDVLSLLELYRAAGAFGRWEQDPAFPRLLQESREATAFAHNVVLLTVASAFDDAGLGPELVPSGNGRTPDLRLRVSARRSIEAEVKTPSGLQRRPGEAVQAQEANRVVRDAIRESRGQLAGPSVLIVGGSFWAGDFDLHAAAVDAAMTRPLPPEASQEARNYRRGLLGVLLAATTIQFARTRGRGPINEQWHTVDWTPASELRWVPNGGYALDLSLELAPDVTSFEISFQP